MSDIFDNLSDKIHNISNFITNDGKKYIQSVFSKGEEIGHKGKIKFEIEKLKWELKQQYSILGKYVSDNKISQSVTDFSHDKNFLELANDVYRLKLYIEELEKRTKKKLTKK
ncbi:MAG: hypothetical protein QF864_10325 [SAR202 cluster bacterium]|nr:hypothetical protein [SAR202 cluster bacterium]